MRVRKSSFGKTKNTEEKKQKYSVTSISKNGGSKSGKIEFENLINSIGVLINGDFLEITIKKEEESPLQ